MPVLTEPPSMGDVLKYEVNPNYTREVITLQLGLSYPAGSVLGRITASGLSRRVSLSAATLSGMLERLEERGLLLRQRDEVDRRRQWLSVSEAGRALLVAAPPLLPPALRSAFAALPEWEKHSLTAALLRVAELCGEVD